MTMRRWISLIENELLTEAEYSGLCYHGTTSNFVESILKNGFKSDPEIKTYHGNLESYKGTYFSDTFTVALFKGNEAVKKFGGNTCVFICKLEHEVAADEDGILQFLKDLIQYIDHEHDGFDVIEYANNKTYRDSFHAFIAKAFADEYGVPATNDFFELFYQYCDQEFDIIGPEEKRALVNKVAHEVGFAKDTGNYEALNFRVPADLDHAHIVCVIKTSYTHPEDMDPSYLPADFQYEVIYGRVPSESVKLFVF